MPSRGILESDAVSLHCFDSIEVSEPIIKGANINSKIKCRKVAGKEDSFTFSAKYEDSLSPDSIAIVRMALVMPLLNYGLFTKEIRLNFDTSESDFSLLKDLLEIFSKDIFVNKLFRWKNPYVLPQFIPPKDDIPEWNAISQARIIPQRIIEDNPISSEFHEYSCGVLSSGGKESLLTYGLLKEIEAEVHPLYVTESGGHWRTALPAYRQFRDNDSKTLRVWTNVDRFYTFMLDQMRIIRKDHRKIWADTYPIRLCIFPVYVFLLLPIFAERKIGNILIGSEFDDPRTPPYFEGIRHYFGVFDQTQDFDLRMEKWFSKRMPGLRQWSALRSISGLIVERILTSRYPALARVQRSCHSCRFAQATLLPCGKCSKCQGVLLFLLANHVDPSIIGYKNIDVTMLPARIAEGNLKLDEDEKIYSMFLSKLLPSLSNEDPSHVETIHVNKETTDLQLLPKPFRHSIIKILLEYTKGFSILKEESWIPQPNPSVFLKGL